MQSLKVHTIEVFIYQMSNYNSAYTNLNGVFDAPEINYTNAVLAWLGQPQDSIFDSRIGPFIPANGGVGSNQWSNYGVKLALVTAGFSPDLGSGTVWTLTDGAALTSFQSHRGLPATGIADSSTMKALLWHNVAGNYQCEVAF